MQARPPTLLITCEHAGCEVPPAYRILFVGHDGPLHSHRGWDAGAATLAQEMAEATQAPLYATFVTRLLVDLNRSVGHPQLFSSFTRGLPRSQRDAIVHTHYRPHREAVQAAVAAQVAAGRQVIHIASHSFTPVLQGVQRRADVGWLYDPRRHCELAFARRWMGLMAPRAPGLQLRRNNPYRGRSDGLTEALRKQHPDAAYVGIELEVNQRFVEQGGAPWDALRAVLVETLRLAMAAWAQEQPGFAVPPTTAASATLETPAACLPATAG